MTCGPGGGAAWLGPTLERGNKGSVGPTRTLDLGHCMPVPAASRSHRDGTGSDSEHDRNGAWITVTRGGAPASPLPAATGSVIMRPAAS